MSKPAHSEFAFSAAPRWMYCAGSMAHPENLDQTQDGGKYANEGTAAHTLASWCLKEKKLAEHFLGAKITAGKDVFVVDEDFADAVQSYLDDVDRRSMGGMRLVEREVTLAHVEGFDETNYGTSDLIAAIPARGNPKTRKYDRYSYGIVEDLKFGRGERVYAWTRATSESLFTFDTYVSLFEEIDGKAPVEVSAESISVEPNFQLMMYALASLPDIKMMVDDPTHIDLVIHQPRLNNISELRVPIAVLERFGVFAAERYAAGRRAQQLMKKNGKLKIEDYNPGEKQCRWCRVADCKARAAKVASEVGADFEVLDNAAPLVPQHNKGLERAFKALPFILDWCASVKAEVERRVGEGLQVIGPDGKPMKFVEGQKGDRMWIDAKKAEEALVGQLATDAYTRKILSVAQAEKKLKKKPNIWKDVFEPMFDRAPGKPQLALGSDKRPPYESASGEEEFDNGSDS